MGASSYFTEALIKFTLLKPLFVSIVGQKGIANEIGKAVYNSNVSLSLKKYGTGIKVLIAGKARSPTSCWFYLTGLFPIFCRLCEGFIYVDGVIALDKFT